MELPIRNRIEPPPLENVLNNKQTGFRKNRNTEDQVLADTDYIEAAFEANRKWGALVIDLSSGYDTIWHQETLLKLHNVLQDHQMVHVISKITTKSLLSDHAEWTLWLDQNL